jgi:hypothetical protein
MRFSLFLGFLSFVIGLLGQSLPVPPFRISDTKNETPNYDECVAWWKVFSKQTDKASFNTFGSTDANQPLTAIVIDGNGAKPLNQYIKRTRPILFINNAIHPGEPDGVDASMMLAYDLIKQNNPLMDSVIVVIVPFYNVGGAMNRNCCTRANQNGPTAYGFRGNAQNLDLNRDFIKCDSRNAQSLTKQLLQTDPELYIETHVSNGADYQYVMTYLATQEDKLGAVLGGPIRNSWNPFLEKKMNDSGFPMVPYVNVHGNPPNEGYTTFYDSPRYSSGWLSLHHIPSYVTETHMLKPYKDRVEATYQFLVHSMELVARQHIGKLKDLSRMEKLKSPNGNTGIGASLV